MHPRVRSRADDLRCFFSRNLRWRSHLGLTWVVVDAAGDVRGTATLEPPGGVPHAPLDLIRHWVLPTLREQGLHTVVRVARTDAVFARTYRALSGARDYWHVHAVAIHAGVRGRGLGSRLLRCVLSELDDHVDRDRGPVLLNTQRRHNVALYRRLGFELMASVSFHGYSSWFMRRARRADP